MKLFRRLLFSILGILIIAVAGSYIYLKQQTPSYSGEVQSNQIIEDAEILYDEYGIPHIYAKNAEDAYFALGYAQAQDRLFQMTLISRLVSGRMSELMGESMVKTDKYYRTMGVRKKAEELVRTHLSEVKTPIQKEVTAFIKGVNHYIDNNKSPIEFSILGIEKEAFTAVDVFANVVFTSMGFTRGFRTDVILEQIQQNYGEAYLADWFMNSKDYQTNKGVVNDSTQLSDEALSMNTVFPEPIIPIWEGSNAWAIAPFRSKSGKAITANDTHVGFSQPSVWYEAHIEYPGFSFYGSHIAGVPFATIGHNKDVSWGLTIFPIDVTDLYRERINPDNNSQVWENDHWADMDIRQETIKIKDGEDISFEIKTTRHGPIMNEVLEGLGDQPVSLWWAMHHVPGNSLHSFYNLSHSKNIDDARAAAALNDFLGLNIIFGDKDGNIAWWASGKIPKRPAHVNPAVILDGASGLDEVEGYYDFADNPSIENPSSGIIVSSNQEPHAVNGYVYPGYYAPIGRFDRITDVLSKKDKWSIEELKSVHADNTNTIHADNAHFFATELKKDESLQANPLVEILANWQGDYPLESTAAVIYTKLAYYITEYMMKDELGEDAFAVAKGSSNYKGGFPNLSQNPNSPWWDNINTKDVKETQTEIITKAFLQTEKDLLAQLGDDHSKWKWSDVHTLTHVHPIGRQKPFDKVFNVGPLAAPGGNGVPNKQQYRLNPDGKYEVLSGPALRILLDFADIDHSLNINPTGQSGNFMSPHYQDQAVMFNNVEYREQKTDRQDIEESSTRVIIKKMKKK